HLSDCAKCKETDDKDGDQIKCGSENKDNCEEIKFREGSATHCARYECQNVYLVKDGRHNKYYPHSTYPKGILCKEPNKLQAPDKESVVQTGFGC
ncbi:hypothetical protein PMAYCL1PPCAC_19424, partial [Pristionchus mayeri]